MSEGHSYLAPSAASRWLACPGSPAAEAAFPDRVGYEAAEGTALHEVAAQALEFGVDPLSHVGKKWLIDGHEVELTQDAIEPMFPGLARLTEMSDGLPMFIERRVEIDCLGLDPKTRRKQGGTVDVAIIDILNNQIVIWDWKFGRGVPVPAEGNPQPMLYALGVWQAVRDTYPFDEEHVTFALHIEQPRLAGAGGTHVVTLTELREFEAYVAEVVAVTRGKRPPRAAGDHCRWCQARAHCKTFAEHQSAQLALLWDELDGDPTVPSIDDLTPEQRANIVRNRQLLISWLNAVQDSLVEDAKAGRPTPGLYLAWGKAPARKWSGNRIAEAEEALKELLGDEAFEPTKLISPTQAEKALGKALYQQKVKEMVHQGQPGVILVPEGSGKPAYQSVSDAFEEIGNNGD